MQKWKSWELALMLALCLFFLSGLWAQNTQEELAEKLVRLHVVANSDSPEDQAAKLRLRDEITAILAPALAEAHTREEALAVIEAQRPAIEALGDLTMTLQTEHFPTRDYASFSLPAGDYLALRVILGEGQGQNWWCVLFPPLCTEALAVIEAQRPAIEALGDLTMTLQTEHFPTRDYASFSLPAGDYLALRVVTGDGAGQNWWCVLFPPLCTEALASSSQETFGLLSEDEKALVTQSDEGYILKFRILELWDGLKNRF